MNLLFQYIREDAEPVEDACSIGDGREQPLEVVLVDALWEEGNDSKKRSGTGAKFLEHGGGEGKLDRCGEALVMQCLQHAHSMFLPFSCQSVHAPLVLVCNSGKQGYRERVEVELLQYVIDEVGIFVTFVDAIEGATGGIHRQCWDFENLVFGRDGGDPQCYTET